MAPYNWITVVVVAGVIIIIIHSQAYVYVLSVLHLK